ncbi:MAG: restriction endonuclease [Candidatus Magnetoglobus multicellularis str. Araruama]|uniref:Restriction endonuclease n=1 Tax=Candidatus Magnetoglobus multicellularis str. Araruama TaxID=890399 RepID=A0A1V1PG55_9BACT|nr:MAG: restriction endonuclease [Candidatus Magnetoglobus multicellularis str. Araruama]
MPAVSPNEIVLELIEAIHQSGGVAAYISESVRTHPRKFNVNYMGNNYSLWVYIWTLTHGGRVSLPDEFRIQMTSVPSPLPMNTKGLTVLMGYHPDLKMFAGFDLEKHCSFTVGSPSVQINISALYDALQNGLSFVTKDNDEIAIGVRPDQFFVYCLNAATLHLYGAENNLKVILSKAAELQEIPQEDINNLAADRKQIVENISRYSRDANFRKLVMAAYDNRCAVTRMQLRLVDAAHILPVPSEESSDHITNGISLSPTFHRAYDNCLIYLDEKFIMKLNQKKAGELKSMNLDGGLKQFCSFLDKKIHLPVDVNQRPRIEYIKRANKYRRIPGYI